MKVLPISANKVGGPQNFLGNNVRLAEILKPKALTLSGILNKTSIPYDSTSVINGMAEERKLSTVMSNIIHIHTLNRFIPS